MVEYDTTNQYQDDKTGGFEGKSFSSGSKNEIYEQGYDKERLPDFKNLSLYRSSENA